MTHTVSAIGADEQREHIQQARAILQPSPVKWHAVPRWLRKRLLAVFKGKRPPRTSTANWALMNESREILGHSLDHYGSTIFREKQAFAIEPYSLSLADVQNCQRFADLIGCDWVIHSNSHWNPGSTIRVLFFESDNN